MAEAEDAKSGSDTEEEDEGEGGLLANADELNRGGKYLGFSPLVLSKREKNVLVLLSLYTFWGECKNIIENFIIQKLKSKHTQKIYKLSKTNLFFSPFERTRGKKTQIFFTKEIAPPSRSRQMNAGNLDAKIVKALKKQEEKREKRVTRKKEVCQYIF